MQSHKISTVVLALTLVAGVGVQVWIHYDKAEKAAADELARQTYIEKLETEESLKLEQTEAEREALIKSIEEAPIVLPEKKEPKVEPKEESEPTDKTTESKEAEEEVVTESKEIKKPELPEDAVTDDPEKHPEYKPEDNVIKDEPNKPQGGEKNEKGEIYVPGFGWMEPGNGGTSEVANMDEGDWDNKIGIMG